MKRIMLTATAVLLSMTAAPAARAQGWCGNADLTGSFAGQLRGSFLAVPGVEIVGPVARVAIVQLDGNGNVNVPFERGVYAGIPATQPFAGTYAVAPDCTIQLVAIPPPPINFPVPFGGTVSDNKREFSLIITGPGAVIDGQFQRMGVAGCTNRTLTGGYSVSMDGTILTPAAAAGPYKANARFEFDGAGTFRASGVSNSKGTPGRFSYSGTYSVASECSLSIDYRVDGVSYKIEGVAADGGRKAVLLQTAPVGAAVITGEMTNQSGRSSGF